MLFRLISKIKDLIINFDVKVCFHIHYDLIRIVLLIKTSNDKYIFIISVYLTCKKEIST